MGDNRRFRMADGAELVGRQGDSFEMRVSIPSDDNGFFGRQCPECSLVFRMDVQQYEALPDDLTLWCVYCGHHAEHSEFMTEQQRDRIMRAAGDFAMQMVSQELDKVFGGLARGSRGSSISFSYKSQPFYPRPLPGIDEEQLVRVRTCADCQNNYAVFGEHRYCPVCGQLPAASVAFDALQADTARLDALEALPADAKSLLREQGVFARNWVDTIENVVGVVEALASSLFRAAAPNADSLLNGKGAIFQRLDHMADLIVATGFSDLRITLGAQSWQRLLETWAARHVFTHNDGIVDEKYLTRVPSSSTRIGQRLVLTDAACRQALDDAKSLCDALVDALR
ncbi:hypothetical protein EJ357_26740 [Streptomyces cyaneochromogenes]|uniref:Uncharacterized protein n=1 Tax=Streptomyces cyaneochromogenes TaxID=2496836 RepID=A0A3S9MBW5_9ACTN|nr:hypothetical protein [Streptomyces cyaneochromogenes]AZQ36593.1 hypothetical protein EJ357_26740 [Streptomyces cyaneochromogenes]